MDNRTLLAGLAEIASDTAVLSDADMAPYLADWRGRYSGQARCVVKPATTEEVAAVVELCASQRIPMVPQGGNTSLCGGATPDESGGAVIINLSRMNRIRDIDTTNNTLTVEAGCILQRVQEAAADAGRLFPLALAAKGSCQIGGNLSTNAGGVNVLRYGNMRDLTLGLEVVLADGRVWNGLRGLRKDNSGYDLKHLFIGAEGTLGIITAAVLKLFPRPRKTAIAWVALRNPAQAVELLQQVRGEFSDRVSGFELIGRPALELVFKHIPGAQDPLTEAFPWYVLIELTDTSKDSHLGAALETFLTQETETGRVLNAVIAHSIAQAKSLWSLRDSISEAQRIDGVSIKHDVSLPASRIAEFLDRASAELQRAFGAVRIVAFGHLGDGNLHYNLSQPEVADNAGLIAQTPLANRIVHDIVASLGGSISAEHGLGQLKRDEILRYKSPLEMQLMRDLKATLDPHRLMNPGKVL